MADQKKQIKPIETLYAGILFRSRLEARWARYFDELKIKWQYEREGFETPSGRYLPDFWLTQVSMWAEVKPEWPTAHDIARCKRVAIGSGHPFLILDGPPAASNYWFIEPDSPRDDLWNDMIFTGRKYWLTEGRFYTCTGLEFPQRQLDNFVSTHEMKAIKTALSARFEFGAQG